MELANALLALSGNRATTVPKYDITPPEVVVLNAIHGDDAVFDIEPTGETVKRSFSAERDRLARLYPARDNDNRAIVAVTYPGNAPVLPTTFDSLGLPESVYKPLAHVKPAAGKRAKAAKAEPAPADDMFADDVME